MPHKSVPHQATGQDSYIALVTGANRGLGLETGRQLLAKGLKVVLTGRDDDALARAAATLAQGENRVMTVRMDVTDVGSIKRAQEAVERGFGRVDVLVNNAGVLLFENEKVLSIPSEAYQRTFETNVFGVIEVCRVFAPEMAGHVTDGSSTCRPAQASLQQCRRTRQPIRCRKQP
jgi:NAD(P)-dependent dehydrogenase (short-subunit alcohol dehydrogenase family)